MTFKDIFVIFIDLENILTSSHMLKNENGCLLN